MSVESMPIATGSQVILRRWTRADTAAHERWPAYRDPFHSLWNLTRSDPNYDGFQSRIMLHHVWAVEDQQQRMIGRITLREVDHQRRSARLGISISATHVSRGLGSEAMRLFIEYYFGSFGFEILNLDVAAFNRRAVRCYERLGFVYLTSDWRSAGNDPSLRLLNEPQYNDYQSFFQRGRFETFVEFYEMRLDRQTWIEHKGQ